MILLLLVVILNVLILILFRLLSHFLVNTFQTIVINYWVCVLTGLIISRDITLTVEGRLVSWIWFAFFLGGVFVFSFFLIARTAQIFDVSIASLASKVSLVIPVFFSLAVFQSFSRTFDGYNYLGLVLTIPAIVFSSIRESPVGSRNQGSLFLLPVLVFILSGIIDTALNYANLRLIGSSEAYSFTITLFFSAALLGTIGLLAGRKKFEPKSIPWGIGLGVINVFTVIVLLKTLTHFNNDGAFVFPVVNIGNILLATLISSIVFRDRWSKFKAAGIILGLVALLLIAHQELIDFLS